MSQSIEALIAKQVELALRAINSHKGASFTALKNLHDPTEPCELDLDWDEEHAKDQRLMRDWDEACEGKKP